MSAAFDGPGALLDTLVAFVRRYVVLSETQADAVALWIVHTHCFVAAEATPYLAITSAEKRSGKSRLLEVLALLCARPLRAAGVTEAALFRSLAASPPPTLLMDEVDAIFGAKAKRDNEDLRALLNAGYKHGTPVLRCVGEGTKQRVEPFAVFGPKALAGIGRLPDTISDRSLPIRLKRRAPGETVDRLRERDARAAAEPLYQQLTALAEARVDQLAEARPALPEELDDRAQDACEALVAIADLAGGGWPERARNALITLRIGDAAGDDANSIGVRLLADIRTAFGSELQLATVDLIERLCGIDDAPWADLHGRSLNPRALASRLRAYRIAPHDLRLNGRILKGYRRDDFVDAWRRYLPTVRDRRDTAARMPLEARARAATAGPVSRHQRPLQASAQADVAGVAADKADGPPCPYPSHRFADWRTPDGRVVCGVCHPQVNGQRAQLELPG